MELSTLMDTYYNDTLPNKRRSRDSILFELHLERNLCKLCDDINSRTLQPTAYTFIVSSPVYREIFAGDMQMRIIQHYVERRIRPLIEKRLIDSTFNNRVGKGSLKAVNSLAEDIFEISNGYTEDCWVIKLDMKGYFPNANQDIAYQQIEQLILEEYKGDDRDDLLYLLSVSIFSYPTQHCYRVTPICEWSNIPDEKSLFCKPDGIGGAIGHLIWQMAMTYYINDICHWLQDECGLRINVYMDDIAIVTRNKECTLALIPELRRRLKELGVTLHPKKFYCQHYSKGAEFIGYHLKNGRIHVNDRSYRKAIKKVEWLNHRIEVKYVDYFISCMNSYIGLLKNGYNEKKIRKLLAKVNAKWWKFVKYDETDRCIRAQDEYRHRTRIINKYKLHDYGHRRIRKKTERKRCKDTI